MADRNNRNKKSGNNGDDLFDSFRKENDDIDNMLNDAFSFMGENDADSNDEDQADYNSDENYEDDYDDRLSNYDDDSESYFDNTDDMVNDYDSESFEEESDEEEIKRAKKKKIIYSVIIGVLSLCIIIISVLLIKFSSLLGKVNIDSGEAPTNNEGETLAEDENFDTMYDVSDASSLNDALKKWANNGGQIMSSKNVINVLLVGEDGDGSKTRNGRSDSIIIASINQKNKTITLSSIMRDSYIYFTANGTDKYERINATNYYGGPKGLIKAVESNYKVNIDYYVSVYFGSFKDVINALGGVTVPIEPGFASYINRTTSQTVKSGDAVKLNGTQALIYCRIRHYYTDSDVSRTKNQRRVINAMIQSAKGASITTLYKAVNSVLPHVKTNMSKSTIISYGKKALSNNWMNYKLQQETYPTLEARATATINSASVWVVDYPLAAQTLQKMIYGKTNINLSPNRTSVLSLYLAQKSTTASYNYNNSSTSAYTYVAPSTTSGYVAPTTQAPITQAPVTQAPATEAPSSDSGEGIYGGEEY